jgi:hypothetical protein
MKVCGGKIEVKPREGVGGVLESRTNFGRREPIPRPSRGPGPATPESQPHPTYLLMNMRFDSMQVAALTRELLVSKASRYYIRKTLDHVPPLEGALLRITNTKKEQTSSLFIVVYCHLLLSSRFVHLQVP